MRDFTIAIPIRNTDEEYNFMLRSLPAAFSLEPEEIIIGLDPNSERIRERVYSLSSRYSYRGEIRFIEPPIDRSWRFRLAHLTYEMYKASSNDIILHDNVDDVLLPRVLIGLDHIKKDYTACVSFTLRLLINNLTDLVRYIGYRIAVRHVTLPVSGLYYLYKPYFFDIIDIDEYKSIVNGIDTYLIHKILRNGKYRLVALKDIGCRCMTYQSGDYPWRQFQYGLWLGANLDKYEQEKLDRLRARYKNSHFRYVMAKSVLDIKSKLCLNILSYCIMYQRWHALYGFRFARSNPSNEAVKTARVLEFSEWINRGSTFFEYIPTEIAVRYLPRSNEMTGFVK